MKPREIGGYFELERLKSNELYSDYDAFSSARNCLRFILRERHVKKIYIPYFLCDAFSNVCDKEGVKVDYYHIGRDFLPDLNGELSSEEYICIVNYYGLIDSKTMALLNNKYTRMIIDNTHAFFMEHIDGVDTIYNCRKYFGVPDGAYLASELSVDGSTIKKGKSGFRMKHLIGRFEDSAFDYYEDFKKSEESFYSEDLTRMSNLTQNIMGAIDYDYVLECRKNNIAVLHNSLQQLNRLDFNIESMNFMYPFMTEKSRDVRNALIRNNVFVPTLWPNVFENGSNELECMYARDIIPIPIDQRYDRNDMMHIINIIKDNCL